MASIKDALEESIGEDFAVVKHFIYAVPVFICYILFSKGNLLLLGCFGFFTFLMLLTIFIQVIYNVRNGKNIVLPTFNIITFIVSAIKALFAIIPLSVIGIIAGILLTGIEISIPLGNIQLIYSIIVWLIIGSILITSVILYSKTQHIKDAYNLILISNSCIDILIAILFFIPQLLLIDGIILGGIAYLFAVFFNLGNPVFIFLCCMALINNIIISADYFAQLDYEIVVRNEYDNE